MGRLSIRKLVLLALNLAATILTLFTGLRENPIVVFVSGRYDLIRARMINGGMNYNVARNDAILLERLPDLVTVGQSYRFISAPRRTPQNLGTDRSVCMRLNTQSATVLAVYFDDFWGKGPRRTQAFVYSISAPHCEPVTFIPSWYNKTCVHAIGAGNETVCTQYIFDNFDALAKNRLVHAGAETDSGTPGVPFLKCRGRPQRRFEFITDLVVPTAYWAGGSDHIEVQSSRCSASPVTQSADWEFGLFKVGQLDQDSEVFIAIDNTGWFAKVVGFLCGVVTIWMIVHGMLAMILQSRYAPYVPAGARFLHEWRVFKVLFPFMHVATLAPHADNRVIQFKGVVYMASDVWMNHWLYIMLNMLEALTSLRATYITFQMGTWMLTNKINLQNFIFTCSALTKITWIICLVHTLLHLGCKLGLSSMKKLKFIRPRLRDHLAWYIDATAMLASYKVYSILLCVVLFIMLKVRKTTTLMVRQVPGKLSVLGGDPDIARFWGSEVVCDLLVMTVLVLACGIALNSLTLLTQYRYITRNSLLRLLQGRYIVVGWDVYVALEALGMDPFDASLVEDGVCKTSCSIGAVLQQFYTSGMSGHVNLAGDHIFMENGFSKEVPKPQYPARTAIAVGLCTPSRAHSGASVTYKAESNGMSHIDAGPSHAQTEDHDPKAAAGIVRAKSLFERKLKVVSEGYFGRILLVDVDDPGRVVKSKTSTAMEFEANELLGVLSIMDIKPLLGNEKKLHFA